MHGIERRKKIARTSATSPKIECNLFFRRQYYMLIEQVCGTKVVKFAFNYNFYILINIQFY